VLKVPISASHPACDGVIVLVLASDSGGAWVMYYSSAIVVHLDPLPSQSDLRFRVGPLGFGRGITGLAG
jgi:hypothetical protein